MEITLPSLLSQDYPGPFHIVLVDDRSLDDTAAVARSFRDQGLTVVSGAELPQGWTGKVWALQQGASAATTLEPVYYLLTDADIRHATSSLSGLVAESERLGLALNSRMARLHCNTLIERLLIPPFLYFFLLLYPPRLVNDGRRRRRAAAAGGCILARRDALDHIGGFAAMRDRIIDDVSLARAVKRGAGLAVRLAVSRGGVESVRSHDLTGAWRMVRRTAFEQLRRSWLLLGLTTIALALLFAIPPALVVVGATGGLSVAWCATLIAIGMSALILSWATYLPTVRFFGLRPGWAAALPVAGLLYALMTLDSAFRTRRGATW